MLAQSSPAINPCRCRPSVPSVAGHSRRVPVRRLITRASDVAQERAAAADPSVSQQQGEEEEAWYGPGVAQLRYAYELLTDEEVNDLIDYTASLITVIDEVRPLDPATYNASYNMWHAIAAIPPQDRPRLLDEVEPGALSALWRHSLSRYVLDPERCAEIFTGYSVWDDFPDEPGKVIWYDGLVEQTTLQRRTQFIPMSVPGRRGGGKVFNTQPGILTTPQGRFQQGFWCSEDTGLIYSHVRWHLWGPFYSLWMPCYNRLDLGAVLTPVQRDAGADGLLVYPGSNPEGIGLTPSQLPVGWWPEPVPGPVGLSPFSFTGQDYIRAVGPGVYVGCGYTADENGQLLPDNFRHFLLIRRP